MIRAIYAASDPGEWTADPFSCGEHSFFDWLMRPSDPQEPVITNLWHYLSTVCPEMQAGWSDPLGIGRMSLASWIKTEGWQQYDLGNYQAHLPE
jgi:hypothetical protein